VRLIYTPETSGHCPYRASMTRNILAPDSPDERTGSQVPDFEYVDKASARQKFECR